MGAATLNIKMCTASSIGPEISNEQRPNSTEMIMRSSTETVISPPRPKQLVELEARAGDVRNSSEPPPRRHAIEL